MTTDVWLFEYTFRTRADWWLRKFPMCSPYMMIPLGLVTMGRQWWPWMTRRRRRWPNRRRLMMPILVISTSASLAPTYFSRTSTISAPALNLSESPFQKFNSFCGNWTVTTEHAYYWIFYTLCIFCKCCIVLRIDHPVTMLHFAATILNCFQILPPLPPPPSSPGDHFRGKYSQTKEKIPVSYGFIYFVKCSINMNNWSFYSVLIRPENINTDLPSPHILYLVIIQHPEKREI